MKYDISVIIPVYNCEKFLTRCVESVLKQKCEQKLQIILVDDGSTDTSPAICDRFQSENDNVLALHQKNAGVSAARNFGIANAEGEWISFVDSDDYLLDRFYEKMLSGDNADLICCSYTGNSVVSDELDSMLDDKIYSSDEFDETLYPVMANDYIFFQCWNKLYRRSIIIENNLCFPVGIKYAEDMEFVFNYVKYIKNFKFVKSPLYFYYVNEDNTTSVVKKGYETYERIYLFRKQYFEKLGFNNHDLKHDYIFYSLGAIYTAAKFLNIFSAYLYIRNILKNTMFYDEYKIKRIYKDCDGVNGYFDGFVMKKQTLLIIVLVRFTEYKSKKLAKEKSDD